MKFTDGYWQMRPGMIPHYAAQAYDTILEKDAITVFAPIGKIQERGHTVNQPLLTVRFASPMENVIRVRLSHHKGTKPRKPEFEIHPESAPQISISNDESCAMLASGNLRTGLAGWTTKAARVLAISAAFIRDPERAEE